MNPIRIGIAGAGRMGQAIARSVADQDDLQLASLWVREPSQGAGLDLGPATLLSSNIQDVAAAADVLVDFSLPEATAAVVAAVIHAEIPLVIGISGLKDSELLALDAAARSVAIVYDRNMSIGITVLESVVCQAVEALGPEFAVEIQETHHVHKLDAPSGTALKLGAAISRARGGDAADIRYEVERRGEVPGDHRVILSSPTEELTLGHSVTTRQVFADGAIRAARWIVRQGAGRYTMRDVLSKKTVNSL